MTNKLALILVYLLAVTSRVIAETYVYYPFAPNALYQKYMQVSLAAGQYRFYNDLAGIGSYSSFNGVYGIGFDNTETYALITSVESKKFRKLRLSDEFAGPDITRKSHYLCV